MNIDTSQAGYLPYGRSFICHPVGTASDLATQRASTYVAVAGPAQAVGMAGGFGFDTGPRQLARKRSWVRYELGEDVAGIVARYDYISHGWNSRQILGS